MSDRPRPYAVEPVRWLDHAEFGERFVRQAVSTEAVTAAMARITARGMRLGPFTSGPIGLAKLDVEASFGSAVVRRSDADDGDGLVRFEVTVPAALMITARLGPQSRFRADVQIELRLSARTAEPLLIVIDVAQVRSADVRVRLRAEGLAAAAVALIEPFLPEVGRQIARRVNSQLDAPQARAARVIDVAARIDGRKPRPSASPVHWPARWNDYASFGALFVRAAVSPHRVAAALGRLTGAPIEIEPRRTGPRKLAEVSARGVVGEIELSARAGPDVAFDVIVPISLQLCVRLAGAHRYDCRLRVHLALQARAAEPLLLIVDVATVTAEDVEVTIQAGGLAGRVLRRVGDLDSQLRARVATAVNARLADPTGRTFDIAERISR